MRGGPRWRGGPRLRSAFTLLAVLLWLTACAPAAAPPLPTPTSAAGATPAPPFALPTLDGDTLALDDLRGDWVLVNFWATWCAPCVAEMPYFQQVADRYAIHVLGINMRESADLVAQFIDSHAIRYPILLEPDDATLLGYSTLRLPVSAVIAPDGTIAQRIAGPVDPQQFDAWLADHVPPRATP